MPTKIQKIGARFNSCIKVVTGSTGNYISCGNNAGFNLTSALTIEAWVKLIGHGATERTIVSKMDCDASPEQCNYWFGFASGMRLEFKFKKSDGNDVFLVVDSGDALVENVWTHVAATFYNGTDTIQLFINGELKKTTSSAVGDPATTIGSVVIGASYGGSSYGYVWHLCGCIDEVRISNNARTSFDITAPLTVDGSTIALYHFDEATGSTIDNAEGTSARDGTITGNEILWAGEEENIAIDANDIIANINASSEETKLQTCSIGDSQITGAKLASAVAGDGLGQDGSSNLKVNVDDSTIEISSDNLQVKNGGIIGAKLASAVAGDGLSQDGSSNLKVNTDGTTIEISGDNLQVKSGGITTAKLASGVAIPVGSIQMYGGSSAPTGWVLCDGTSYLRGPSSSDTYYNLFQVIGTAFGTADGTHFNVPDMKGAFPRGTGQSTIFTDNVTAATGRTTSKPGGASSGIGSKQDDSYQGHWHNVSRPTNPSQYLTHDGNQTGNSSRINLYPGIQNSTGNNGYAADDIVRFKALGSLVDDQPNNYDPRAALETRPKNIEVNFIIKY